MQVRDRILQTYRDSCINSVDWMASMALRTIDIVKEGWKVIGWKGWVEITIGEYENDPEAKKMF